MTAAAATIASLKSIKILFSEVNFVLIIVGEAQVQASLEIRVVYREVPQFDAIELQLRESLAPQPLLDTLQIESGREGHIICVVNGKLNHPLRIPVREALGLRPPVRLNFVLARRIIELESTRIGRAIESFLPGQQVKFKHVGLG